MGIPWSEVFRERRRAQREVVKWVGSLPVIRAVLRKLDVRGIVDRLCPIREIADYTHGEIVELLVANRLTSPQPLYAVHEWADECAAATMWKMEPSKLNDDRLARTLDATAEELSGIQGAVAAQGIRAYEIKADQLHVDITSFMFEGAYEEVDQDEKYPCIRRGYNAQRDFKRKQVRVGIGTTKDGGVPLLHRTFDGNRTDSTTLIKTIDFFENLRTEAQIKSVIYVGDSKLTAKGNLPKLLCLDAHFVAPGERDAQTKQDILSLDPESWTELSYASESELKKREKAPKEEWNRFWGQEVTRELTVSARDSGKETESRSYRMVFVRSAEEERAAYKNRERQMAKADEELVRIQRGIPRYYKNEEQVKKKVHEVLTKRRVTAFYHIEVKTRGERPCLEWSHSQEALKYDEQTKGRYVLLTNLAGEEYSMDDVLRIQKEQYRVEHRFSHWKGPVGVCPIFLKTNRRIAALIMVTALALMVFCIIEREVRRKLGDKDGYTHGFLPENRRSRPTGKKIFNAVNNVQAIIFEDDQRIDRILNITPKARRVYDALEVQNEDLIEI